MATSINGWQVLAPGDHRLHTYTIPGVPDRRVTLAADAAPILLYVAAWYHQNVHPLDKVRKHGKLVRQRSVDEGGYNYRKSRVNTSWSNHSSGTAIDLDWSKEGAQNAYARRWWTKHARAKTALHRFLARDCQGLVTWGGDWSPRYYDPMHFELRRGVSAADIKRWQKRHKVSDKGVHL